MKEEQIKQINQNIADCRAKRTELVKAFEEIVTKYLKDKENFKYHETTKILIDGLREIEEVNEYEKTNLCELIKLQ